MERSQLEWLVLYQDIDLMLEETATEKEAGFQVENVKRLEEAKEEIARKIGVRFQRTYERLKKRYKHPIVPVQEETCLGCFAKLPTSYNELGRSDQAILTCEHCGRLLYWID